MKSLFHKESNDVLKKHFNYTSIIVFFNIIKTIILDYFPYFPPQIKYMHQFNNNKSFNLYSVLKDSVRLRKVFKAVTRKCYKKIIFYQKCF